MGMGAGFTMLNNLAQIVEALGGDRQAQGVYVLLFTTVNTLGRMIGGYLPEKLLHARGTPRYQNDNLSTLTCMAQLRWSILWYSGSQGYGASSMIRSQTRRQFCIGAACRTIFAPVASAMTCVVALLSAFTNLRWLLGCAMAFGFVFGWHWSLMPVCASKRVLSARLVLLSSGHTGVAMLLDFCKSLTLVSHI